jgi:putative ABC transport system ATP-binding protein
MIRLARIGKVYRSGRGLVEALRDVSIHIRRGAAVAVVGKSGSGKTTLLNCIGGLERPTKGTVTCFGYDIHALSSKALSAFQRQNVGFVFQHGNLLSYLTVSENIAFPLVLNGIDGKQKIQRIETLLEKIGLPEVGAALPRELSGGEIQRVAAARALAHSPKILLADEPTASLDTATGNNLVQLIFDMGQEQGCTLVIATHDPEIFHFTEKTVHLSDGRVVKPQGL